MSPVSFRDPKVFDLLVEKIIPDLVRDQSPKTGSTNFAHSLNEAVHTRFCSAR